MKVMVNNRWPLELPDFRAERPGWSWWEKDALAVLHAIIRPDDVVWDVGTEMGDLAALYASWGARVLLIEPESDMWLWINWTFEANNLIPYDRVAARVGAETGLPDRVTLDDLTSIPLITIPDVIVMDIEGAEYQALMGAERLLRDVRPIWMISIHPEHLRRDYGDTPDDVLCHMEKMGYDAHRVSYDHEHHWLFKPLPGWTP